MTNPPGLTLGLGLGMGTLLRKNHFESTSVRKTVLHPMKVFTRLEGWRSGVCHPASSGVNYMSATKLRRSLKKHTCPIGQPGSNLHLPDHVFYLPRASVSVKPCICDVDTWSWFRGEPGPSRQILVCRGPFVVGTQVCRNADGLDSLLKWTWIVQHLPQELQ